jgi:hypothetical protein
VNESAKGGRGPACGRVSGEALAARLEDADADADSLKTAIGRENANYWATS